MLKKLMFLLIWSASFLVGPICFAETLISQKDFVSKNKKFKIIQKCFKEGKDDFYCNFYTPQKNVERKDKLIYRYIKYEDAFSWLASGNIGRIYLGGCGTSCFREVYVNSTYETELYENTIALDERNLCIAYPGKNAIVFKKLFSKEIKKRLPYKTYPYLEAPAQLALIEGKVLPDGNFTLSFYSTELPDDREGEVNLKINFPCATVRK